VIHIKTEDEIKIMKEGGVILAEMLGKLKEEARPGITTADLEKLSKGLILSCTKKYPDAGIRSAFLGYRSRRGDSPYPATLCVSVNDEVVHAVPSKRRLKDGDLVSLDYGIVYKGFNVDSALTVGVGSVTPLAQKLIDITAEALNRGIAEVKPGNTLGDIGYAIQSLVESHGFSVVRDLVGHGIGRELHEEPYVPNYGKPGKGLELKPGMVIAIEPMVTVGSYEVVQDGFSWRTKEGSLSAHFEHTVAVTKEGDLVLTKFW
jgi:methionyl aminopeptidase